MGSALNPKQLSAIARAKRQPALQPILFAKAKGLAWFSEFVKEGFLDPASIPAPMPTQGGRYMSVPTWPITSYLANSSVELSRPEERATALAYLDFIRRVSAFAKEKQISNFRVWHQFAKIIRNLPSDLLSSDDVQMFDFWLHDPFDRGLVAEELAEQWVPKLMTENDSRARGLALGVLRCVFSVPRESAAERSDAYSDLSFGITNWYAKKITDAISSLAGRYLGIEVIQLFESLLAEALKMRGNDRWSSIARPAIEDHDQNHKSEDAINVLIDFCRDATLSLIDHSPAESVTHVEEMLASELNTLARMAIYFIDIKFEHLGALTDKVLRQDFFDDNYRHELWNFLRHRYPHFDASQKAKLREIIRGLGGDPQVTERSETARAYEQAIWLAAVKDCERDLLEQYDFAVRVAGGSPDHPAFASYFASGWVEHRSPFTVEQMLSMDVVDLVEKIDAFEPSAGIDIEKPSRHGIERALRQAIKTEPMKFALELKHFQVADAQYICEVIEAFRELISEGAELPWRELWERLHEFVTGIVYADGFWTRNADLKDSQSRDQDSLVKACANLIESGARDDKKGYSVETSQMWEGIVNYLLSHVEGREFKSSDDAVNLAMNNSRGRCIDALVNVCLKACRSQDAAAKSHEDAFRRFEPIFDRELSPDNRFRGEFLTLGVMYLQNFLYMSKVWTVRNLPKLFNRSQRVDWLCAMQGYMYVNSVYQQVYSFLRDGGHFAEALEDDDLNRDRHLRDKIVQNAVVAYLAGFESAEDKNGLLSRIITRRHPDELHQLIWFFWTLRKKEDENVTAKAMQLWPMIIDAIASNSETSKKLGARLSSWLAFIDELNDSNRSMVFDTVGFAEYEHIASELLEALARISIRQPREAAELWIHVLEVSHPWYPTDEAKSALSTIYLSGEDGKRLAKRIASNYLEDGNIEPSNFLKELQSTQAGQT